MKFHIDIEGSVAYQDRHLLNVLSRVVTERFSGTAIHIDKVAVEPVKDEKEKHEPRSESARRS